MLSDILKHVDDDMEYICLKNIALKNKLSMDVYVLNIGNDDKCVFTPNLSDMKHLLNGYARCIIYKQVKGTK